MLVELGLVCPHLGGHIIKHSMRVTYLLLQSQTPRYLPESPTLVPLVGDAGGRGLLQIQVG